MQNTEQKEQNWKHHNTLLQDIPQIHSNQNSIGMVLGVGVEDFEHL
jgi:hypothetical protein